MPGVSWSYESNDRVNAEASANESRQANAKLDAEERRRMRSVRGIIGRTIESGRTLAQMFRDPAYSFPMRLKFLAIAAAVYLVSPIDFIPDFIFPVGIADDLSLIALIFALFMAEVEKYRDSRLVVHATIKK